MNILKRILPNLITLANLICGLLSIIFAFKGSLDMASLCIFSGAFFDLFDGLTARALKVSNQLGKQLDSMADMVTFGVAPGFIMFNFMFYLSNDILFRHSMSNQPILLPTSLALLIPILSAYRLANFNIDKKQTASFIGLPTPALGIFFAAIPHINFKQFPMFIDMNFLTIICIIMPLLLVVNMPLFSFKLNPNENITSKVNILRATLILSTVILFLAFQFAAIPFIVILYLILSLLNNIL
ncbi:MAG: phosphatidylserine synthase [Flavobacteriales bacterium]|nr:phosphatidylserine synthase [Flavobacteriales bacterium]|tara:strand:- start:14116 stop:14838 length:723 start_codon:yes stop_codon:yes gene_type:complete